MAEYNKRIKDLREDNDLNQTQLAKAINSTQKTISNWEKGYSEPNIEMIKLLCHFFKVSSDYLIGLTDNPEPNRATVNKQVTISGKKNKMGDITIK